MFLNYEILRKEKLELQRIISEHNLKVDIKASNGNLYTENNRILISENCIISPLSSSEYEYISLIEPNVNLSRASDIDPILVLSNVDYEMLLSGSSIGDVKVELHMLLYDKNNIRINGTDYVLNFNSNKVLKFKENVHSVRFLIRISGEGIAKNIRVSLNLKYNKNLKREIDLELFKIKEIEDEDNIKIEDYNSNKIFGKTKFNSEEFYTESKDIVIKNNIIEVSSKVKSEYISIYEKNNNFDILPKNSEFEIDKDYNYYISFKGKKDIDLNAQLFMIFYSDNEKIEVDSVFFNQEKIITPNKDAKYLRLAIRVEGNGELALKEISISMKKRIGFLSHGNLKKLGFDVPKKISDVKIACIFDEFTTECYKDMCKLIPITPDNWKGLLSIEKPHMLMVESAWIGNNGAWTRKVAYNNQNNIKELRELIQWCKKNDIPTVFWNKEDPVHYNVFINTSKLFEYIFTTDENSVDNYKKDNEHDRVFSLPFAAQPKVHNPIKIAEKRNDAACFAGSYYAAKYPERKADIDRLLEAAVDTIGIEIYDRKYGFNDKDFMFPEKFRPYIQGKLDPHELHVANKGYKVMINVNSVKESPTMFSRRVFEGLACATPVVSSYSEGVINIFGDLVTASDDLEELKEEFTKLYMDKDYYEKKALIAMRSVMENHTYSNRLKYILDKIGIVIENESPSVNILANINSIDEYKKALDIYKKQNHLNKKLTVLIPNDDIFINIINENNEENIEFLLVDYYKENKIPLSKLFNEDYVGFVSTRNYYGENYLKDLIIATKYSESEIIGKKAYYSKDLKGKIINEDKQFIYVDNLELDKCIISKNIYDNWTIIDYINRLVGKNIDLFNGGVRLFAVDKFNFIANCQNYDEEIIEKIEV